MVIALNISSLLKKLQKPLIISQQIQKYLSLTACSINKKIKKKIAEIITRFQQVTTSPLADLSLTQAASTSSPNNKAFYIMHNTGGHWVCYAYKYNALTSELQVAKTGQNLTVDWALDTQEIFPIDSLLTTPKQQTEFPPSTCFLHAARNIQDLQKGNELSGEISEIEIRHHYHNAIARQINKESLERNQHALAFTAQVRSVDTEAELPTPLNCNIYILDKEHKDYGITIYDILLEKGFYNILEAELAKMDYSPTLPIRHDKKTPPLGLRKAIEQRLESDPDNQDLKRIFAKIKPKSKTKRTRSDSDHSSVGSLNASKTTDKAFADIKFDEIAAKFGVEISSSVRDGTYLSNSQGNHLISYITIIRALVNSSSGNIGEVGDYVKKLGELLLTTKEGLERLNNLVRPEPYTHQERIDAEQLLTSNGQELKVTKAAIIGKQFLYANYLKNVINIILVEMQQQTEITAFSRGRVNSGGKGEGHAAEALVAKSRLNELCNALNQSTDPDYEVIKKLNDFIDQLQPYSPNKAADDETQSADHESSVIRFGLYKWLPTNAQKNIVNKLLEDLKDARKDNDYTTIRDILVKLNNQIKNPEKMVSFMGDLIDYQQELTFNLAAAKSTKNPESDKIITQKIKSHFAGEVYKSNVQNGHLTITRNNTQLTTQLNKYFAVMQIAFPGINFAAAKDLFIQREILGKQNWQAATFTSSTGARAQKTNTPQTDAITLQYLAQQQQALARKEQLEMQKQVLIGKAIDEVELNDDYYIGRSLDHPEQAQATLQNFEHHLNQIQYDGNDANYQQQIDQHKETFTLVNKLLNALEGSEIYVDLTQKKQSSTSSKLETMVYGLEDHSQLSQKIIEFTKENFKNKKDRDIIIETLTKAVQPEQVKSQSVIR